MSRPLTTMLPRNAMPTKKFIVSDPDKLDYFARAALTRAGTNATWGSFSGFGAVEMDQASVDTTKTPGALQTIGDMARALGATIFGAQTPPPVVYPPPEPSPVPMILGVLAVGVAGYALYRVMK